MATVIFDLDGTLADTSGDLLAAANVTLAELGVSERLEPGQDDAIAMRGGRAMLTLATARAGLDPAQSETLIEAGYPVLLKAYGAAISEHTRLFPGAMDAVQALVDKGNLVGLCTNKPEALADQLLRELGVRDAFGSLIGADTLPTRKPDPAPFRAAVERAGGDPARACLVGDTVTDLDTARNAGVPCILVDFGPSRAGAAALKPDAKIADFNELPAVVAAMFPGGD